MGENAAATPRALRNIISIIGRRNAGKSSLINAICGQDVAIVSAQAGTTTDAVAKPYELLPLGPVTFYDTAGLDDKGELGELRIKATRKALLRSDIAVIVCGEEGLGEPEKKIIDEVRGKSIPFMIVFNKCDAGALKKEDADFCNKENIRYVAVSAARGLGIDELKAAMIETIPEELKKDPLLAGDLFNEGDTVVMVVPIDLSAPKGRLILPQVQVLREILDRNAVGVVAKDRDLSAALANMQTKPALVITDSQVIMKVAPMVPEDIPLTTFSILFARYKGDAEIMVKGAEVIDRLADGDKVLIAEACSHHALEDDIGKVKIPRWIEQYSGKKIEFSFCHGGDFPEDLEKYALVIHCGACMLNRVEMIRRLRECVRRGVPITNYGVAISKTQGVLERVIRPLGLK